MENITEIGKEWSLIFTKLNAFVNVHELHS